MLRDGNRLPLAALREADRPADGTFRVHSRFFTVQGEGSNAGKLAYFVRFAGCNAWDGMVGGKGAAACARICDTEFFGGENWTPEDLVADVSREMREKLAHLPAFRPEARGTWRPDVLIVFTGGEPLLQLARPEGKQFLDGLRDELQGLGFLPRFCLETNGSVPPPYFLYVGQGGPFHHITLSPKTYDPPVNLKFPWRASELKVLSPLFDPKRMLAAWNTFVDQSSPRARTRLWVQPVASGNDISPANVEKTFQFVTQNPTWRLSVQGHKAVGLD